MVATWNFISVASAIAEMTDRRAAFAVSICITVAWLERQMTSQTASIIGRSPRTRVAASVQFLLTMPWLRLIGPLRGMRAGLPCARPTLKLAEAHHATASAGLGHESTEELATRSDFAIELA